MSEGGGIAPYGGVIGAIANLFRSDRSPSQYNAAIGQARYVADYVDRTGVLPGLPRPIAYPGRETSTLPQTLAAALRGVVTSGVIPSAWDGFSPQFSPLPPTATPPTVPAPTPGTPTPAPGPSTPLPSPRTPAPATQQPTVQRDLREYVRLAVLAAQAAAFIRELIGAFRRSGRAAPPGFPVIYLATPNGGTMPYYFSQPANGGSGFNYDPFGLGSLAGGVASVINAIRGPQAMPGGYPLAFGDYSAVGVNPTVGSANNVAMLSSGRGACPTSPWAVTTGAPRASTFVMANPVSGKATWFKPAGRPLLWSGDLSACRRVKKIASRARRRVGGR